MYKCIILYSLASDLDKKKTTQSFKARNSWCVGGLFWFVHQKSLNPTLKPVIWYTVGIRNLWVQVENSQWLLFIRKTGTKCKD